MTHCEGQTVKNDSCTTNISYRNTKIRVHAQCAQSNDVINRQRLCRFPPHRWRRGAVGPRTMSTRRREIVRRRSYSWFIRVLFWPRLIPQLRPTAWGAYETAYEWCNCCSLSLSLYAARSPCARNEHVRVLTVKSCIVR